MRKLMAAGMGLAVCAMACAAAGKPSIVVILNDDMGYADLACFGAPKIKTPRVDRLAEEGRRFASLRAASSVCSASRAALLTGCYPQRAGVPGVSFPNRGARHPKSPKANGKT